MAHTGATLHGQVFNNAATSTSYWFRYGRTTSYGQETEHRSIDIEGSGGHPVSEVLEDLDADTTYHYRLCAQDATPRAGPGCGTDQTFTTEEAPPAELSITGAPALVPEFEPGVSDYVAALRNRAGLHERGGTPGHRG